MGKLRSLKPEVLQLNKVEKAKNAEAKPKPIMRDMPERGKDHTRHGNRPHQAYKTRRCASGYKQFNVTM